MHKPSVLLLIVGLAACREESAPVYARPGDPLPGLDSAQLAGFARGRELFDRDFTPETGLGPLLNDERCASCHDLPTLGGMGGEVVQKATRFEHGRCDLLFDHGGDLLQRQSIPALRRHGIDGEEIPLRATAVTRILPPALYGGGLLDAIATETLTELADSADENGDGISGRLGQVSTDGTPGRFGRKATFPTLRSFVAGALLGEMGITTADAPREERPNGQPLPAGTDAVADPELTEGDLLMLVRYLQLLAAPAPETPANAAARDSIARGFQLFAAVGCASCHVPTLRTGKNVPAPLRQRSLALYSDLLLHDLGEVNASICARGASPSEWRTTPLMGLRYRHGFLHDGRAATAEAAIDAHGGEAAASRDRFRRLPPEQQLLLLRFLRSL